MQNDRTCQDAPALSVLTTTARGTEDLGAWVAGLLGQSAAPESFEVVVVVDGLGGAACVRAEELPFACTIVQRSGLTAPQARNIAISMAQGKLLLFLDPDVVPAPDLVARHLAAHAELGADVAVVGSLPFAPTVLASPFAQMLDSGAVLRPWSSLTDGAEVGWTMFRAANLSVAADSVRLAGGFDEGTFENFGGDDVELGLRLAAGGLRVVHRAECVAHSQQSLQPSSFAVRAYETGRAVARMSAKHPEVVPCWPVDDAERQVMEDTIVTTLEERASAVDALMTSLEQVETEFVGQTLEAVEQEHGAERLVELAEYYHQAGLHRERTGIDPFDLMQSGAPAGLTVSIIVVSRDARAMTQRCIESLRRGADPRYSQEILVVDNGSTDGSAEWLAQQKEVTLIRNPRNFGAPRARNQALARARGQWTAFLDNDVVVPAGWLDRALYHGAVDPNVGAVALCANRASKRQVLDYDGPDDDQAIDAFARDHFLRTGRAGVDAQLFTSLAVLVRREVTDEIGGFDEAFSPWGFEDDDLALRIYLAGWRNRVALDSFVYHAPYATQEKADRHSGWLVDNWHAFVQKWSPSIARPELFDYAALRIPARGAASEAQLHFPLPTSDARPPTWSGADSVEAANDRPVADASAPPVEGLVDAAISALASGGDLQAAPARDEASNSERANVLVLGCGRSGTSLVTGMLAEAGWFVGDDPYAPRDANAKGFFETEEINGINEYLLIGALADEPPMQRMQHWVARAPRPLTFAVDPAIEARMQRLAGRGPYAFKDPRFCYTLDAWRVATAGAKHICVFRDPSTTAASIVRECHEAEYMHGVGVDFEHALEVWQAMYRRVLDDHARNGDWLFVHFDQLFTDEGVSRLEAFVGAPVARDFPERGLSRSPAGRPIRDAEARTYRELCDLAGHEPGQAEVVARQTPSVYVERPELTVLICTYNRRETLRRCIESFEQQTAVDRYEVVVVNDGSTDGTFEALSAWVPRCAARVVHRKNGGLSAARNSGLEVARGKYVLLVNDDTIAAPSLVVEHLEAHERRGPGSMILGTFEQPRAALDGALMRVLERTYFVFCYSLIEADTPYDWNRFWTCNVSVEREAVMQVGAFDESFRHYGCEDTDLGFRLCKELGMTLWFEPRARAEHEHVLTFDDLKRRSRTVGAAYVRFFKKHPEALRHPAWAARMHNSLRVHEEHVVRTLPERARAEAFARELAQIDVGRLERVGEEGAAIAKSVCGELERYLMELYAIWWAEGESDGMRALGIDRMAELIVRRGPESTAAATSRVGAAAC